MRRVVAGYDGSPAALAAARVALDLAAAAGASVTFVHAVGLIERYEGIDAVALPAELAALAAELGVTDVAWLADQGEPTNVLLREAARRRPRRGGVARTRQADRADARLDQPGAGRALGGAGADRARGARASARQRGQRAVGVGLHVQLAGDDREDDAVGADDEGGPLAPCSRSSERLTP